MRELCARVCVCRCARMWLCLPRPLGTFYPEGISSCVQGKEIVPCVRGPRERLRNLYPFGLAGRSAPEKGPLAVATFEKVNDITHPKETDTGH